MTNDNELPNEGRLVQVRVMGLGDTGYGPPETYAVAMDDDDEALQAVKKTEDFAPNDDRLIEVLPARVPKNALASHGLARGGVKRV